MSRLSEFIAENEITVEALLSASRRIERHTKSDRELKLRRKQLRMTLKKGDAGEKELTDDEKKRDLYQRSGIAKPRSGRPLTRNIINAALAGKPVTRKSRSKILAAVNAVLEKKNAKKVDLAELFGDVERKRIKAAGGAKK